MVHMNNGRTMIVKALHGSQVLLYRAAGSIQDGSWASAVFERMSGRTVAACGLLVLLLQCRCASDPKLTPHDSAIVNQGTIH
jgi:hypothetical protein